MRFSDKPDAVLPPAAAVLADNRGGLVGCNRRAVTKRCQRRGPYRRHNKPALGPVGETGWHPQLIEKGDDFMGFRGEFSMHELVLWNIQCCSSEILG
jgi:hypothetical protein